jgi:hypothetical protein
MELLREQLGFNDPLLTQFLRYLADLAQGRLGYSYTYSEPVLNLILDRLGPTLLLTGTAALISVVSDCGWGSGRPGAAAASSTRPRPAWPWCSGRSRRSGSD